MLAIPSKVKVKQLRDWLGAESADYTDDELFRDLVDAYALADCGYERAKKMEAAGYVVNDAMVNLLRD